MTFKTNYIFSGNAYLHEGNLFGTWWELMKVEKKQNFPIFCISIQFIDICNNLNIYLGKHIFK